MGVLVGPVEQLPELGDAALLSEEGVALRAQRQVADHTDQGLREGRGGEGRGGEGRDKKKEKGRGRKE